MTETRRAPFIETAKVIPTPGFSSKDNIGGMNIFDTSKLATTTTMIAGYDPSKIYTPTSTIISGSTINPNIITEPITKQSWLSKVTSDEYKGKSLIDLKIEPLSGIRKGYLYGYDPSSEAKAESKYTVLTGKPEALRTEADYTKLREQTAKYEATQKSGGTQSFTEFISGPKTTVPYSEKLGYALGTLRTKVENVENVPGVKDAVTAELWVSALPARAIDVGITGLRMGRTGLTAAEEVGYAGIKNFIGKNPKIDKALTVLEKPWFQKNIEVLDKTGKTVLDTAGKKVYEKVLDATGKPLLDSTGKEVLAKTASIPGTIIKTGAGYLAESAALFTTGNAINKQIYLDNLPTSVRNNPELLKTINTARAQANAKTINDLGLGGSLAETFPGMNIPYSILAKTDAKYRENLNNNLIAKGINQQISSTDMAQVLDASVGFRTRSKPIEYVSTFTPGRIIEGGGRNVYNIIFKELGKKGPIAPSAALKIIGGGPKWLQGPMSSLIPGGKTLVTGFLGAIESPVQDYISQVTQAGGKLISIKKPSSNILPFGSVPGDQKDLSASEASTIYAEIQGKKIAGNMITVPNTNTATITDSNTGQIVDTQVTKGTLDVKKYELDKDGKIYNVLVDKDGKIVGATVATDVSQQYDPVRGALAVGIGAYASSAIQKGIMRSGVMDVTQYYGGKVKLPTTWAGKVADYIGIKPGSASGKFSLIDYTPLRRVDDTTGKINFGSTTGETSKMVGLTPGAWKQRVAYMFDWTEKPGDILQDWSRRFRTGIGRDVSDPTMMFEGTRIPIRTRTNTMATNILNTLGVTSVGPGATTTTTTGKIGGTSFDSSSMYSDNFGFGTQVQGKPDTRKSIMPGKSPFIEQTTQINPDNNKNVGLGTFTGTTSGTTSGTTTGTTLDTSITNFINTPVTTDTSTMINTLINSETSTNTNIPVNTPTDTTTSTTTSTNTNTNTATNTNVNVNTFLRGLPSAWPGAGALPGELGVRGYGGSTRRGRTVENPLRNFFFEKLLTGKMSTTSKGSIMIPSLKSTPATIEQLNVRDKMSELLGTKKASRVGKSKKSITISPPSNDIQNRVIMNTTPFSKKDKRWRVG
jgi:hypothetical protein